MSKNIVFVPITNFATIKVQIYLLFIIMSYYQVFLNPIENDGNGLKALFWARRVFMGPGMGPE